MGVRSFQVTVIASILLGIASVSGAWLSGASAGALVAAHGDQLPAISMDLEQELDGAADEECRVLDIEAGPIWDNDHAKRVCPAVCARNRGAWTGNWTTTVWGQMSVCNCSFGC